MTRPRKQTVDYFPHTCTHGRTMFILEQRYGNDGYAFWFKLLEVLGASDGHYIDCNEQANLEYLCVKTCSVHVDISELLNLLAKLGAIDQELWKAKIVWSENFVKGVLPVYRNRRVEPPEKPKTVNKSRTKSTRKLHVDNRRVEESIVIPPFIPPTGGNGVVPFLKVQESWNQNAPPLLPRIKVLDEKRKRLIKAAWQEHPELVWFDGFFRDINLSDHHAGRNDKGWAPDISWILKERVRLQERFDSLREVPGYQGAAPKTRNPDCPRCRGSGLYQSGKAPDGSPVMTNCNCTLNPRAFHEQAAAT